MAKKQSKPIDDVFEVGRGWSNESPHGDGDVRWWEGEAVTPHGIVTTYREAELYTLSFAHAGQLHKRTHHAAVDERTIMRRAFAFARDVAARHV